MLKNFTSEYEVRFKILTNETSSTITNLVQNALDYYGVVTDVEAEETKPEEQDV